MSLETEILNIVEADAAVIAIGPDTWHEWADQNQEKPYLVITRISSGRDYALDVTDSLKRARMQVDCFADGFESTSSLVDAVVDALLGYQGTAGSYTIDSIILDNQTSLGEQDGDKIDRRISLDFMVYYL